MKRLAVSLACLAVTFTLGAPASAQKPVDLKQRIDALDKQVAELAQAAAQAATASASVQELSTKVAALEQAVDALGRTQQAHGALVSRGDELERRIAAVEATANGLATRLGDVEQPAVAGGGVAHDDGFKLETGDGRYSMTLGGYFQPRLETVLSDQADSVDSATFRLRRARVSLAGQLGADDLTYAVTVELADPAVALFDGYVDYDFVPGLAIRVGQAKVPFTRLWMTSDDRMDFLERPAGLDDLRYDRDLGAWLHGSFAGGRATYVAGLSNGGGKNAVNDNIDFVAAARVDAAVVGERFEGYGDLERSPEPRVMVGVGAVHDLVRLPDTVAGVAVGERDVDGDGVADNVRVLSFSADAALRVRGLELAVESYFRQERWGTILEHSANADLAAAVHPSGTSGHRNYVGAYAELSYLIATRWLVGARVAHTRLSVLGVGGQRLTAVPPGDRLFELDLTGQLIQSGRRSLGVDYTFFNYNMKDGPEPAADKSHRFIVEYQWHL